MLWLGRRYKISASKYSERKKDLRVGVMVGGRLRVSRADVVNLNASACEDKMVRVAREEY